MEDGAHGTAARGAYPTVNPFSVEGSAMALKNIFLVAAALAALPAAAAIREPGGVGPALRVSPDEEAAVTVSGNGVRGYQCRVGGTELASDIWSFVAPDVALYGVTRCAARYGKPNLVGSI